MQGQIRYLKTKKQECGLKIFYVKSRIFIIPFKAGNKKIPSRTERIERIDIYKKQVFNIPAFWEVRPFYCTRPFSV